jgi:branched-chain amino acid aminotransferase
MPEPLVYLNGCFLRQSEAHLNFYDAGFIFGATATDLCRTFRHQLFRLSDHLARFRRSCELTRIPQQLSDTELTEVAHRLVTHNAALLQPDHDLALVMFATPGLVGYYAGQAGAAGDATPTLCLHTFPLPFRRYVRLFREGACLFIPSTRHVPGACVDPRAKQRSRLHWWLAEQEAHQFDPLASALLLDLAGHVTESAASNFLVVRQGVVLSPPGQSILGGISLQVVKELCAQLGLPFEERALEVSDCLTADEALLTSTPYCVAGVRTINGTPLPWPGPIWRRLLEAWSATVGLDIAGQMEKLGTHP